MSIVAVVPYDSAPMSGVIAPGPTISQALSAAGAGTRRAGGEAGAPAAPPGGGGGPRAPARPTPRALGAGGGTPGGPPGNPVASAASRESAPITLPTLTSSG